MKKLYLMLVFLMVGALIFTGCEQIGDVTEDTVDYNLTIDIQGEGDIVPDPVDSPHVYEEGTTVYLTITPATDWEFSEWIGDNGNDVVESDKTNYDYMINMDSDKNITAVLQEATKLFEFGSNNIQGWQLNKESGGLDTQLETRDINGEYYLSADLIVTDPDSNNQGVPYNFIGDKTQDISQFDILEINVDHLRAWQVVYFVINGGDYVVNGHLTNDEVDANGFGVLNKEIDISNLDNITKIRIQIPPMGETTGDTQRINIGNFTLK